MATDAREAGHEDATWPAGPDDAALRIGDDERRRVRELLQQHWADGRLDVHEFEERLGRALLATTRADLDPLLADLPPTRTRAEVADAAARRRRAAVAGIRGWLGLAAMFVAIWLFTGADGHFWPIWPILGIGSCAVPGALATLRGDDGPAPARR